MVGYTALIIIPLFMITGNIDYVSQTVSDLLNFVSDPAGSCIFGYLAKSAFENREKIKNNPHPISHEPMEGEECQIIEMETSEEEENERTD